jgi:hypothetical protein
MLYSIDTTIPSCVIVVQEYHHTLTIFSLCSPAKQMSQTPTHFATKEQRKNKIKVSRQKSTREASKETSSVATSQHNVHARTTEGFLEISAAMHV